MTELKTIILAAGKGVRMKSDTPKVLHRVCYKPMLKYVLDVVGSLKSRQVVIVLGHKSQLIKQHLGKDIDVILQKKMLGTADAVRITAGHFKDYQGDILILCGDTPLLEKATVKNLIRIHRKTKAACTFLTSRIENPRGYGRVIRDKRGMVVAIREEKDATSHEKKINEINTGVYCFRSQPLFKFISGVKVNPKKKEFYLTDMIHIFSQEGLRIRTAGTSVPYEGLGINTREDLAFAECVVSTKVLKMLMSRGVTVVNPQTTYVAEGVKIGRDSIIYPFTIIEPDVRIGRNCLIGPFCRLRPGTRIGNDVEIGNFSEISRAKVGDQCFMKHFGYLGDAVVGNRVNIGAGVVTANFDGKRKHITRISNDAFVGSDSILVAPLKVGQGAVTGAGCVIPRGKNVPARSVVAGVPARIFSRRRNK